MESDRRALLCGFRSRIFRAGLSSIPDTTALFREAAVFCDDSGAMVEKRHGD